MCSLSLLGLPGRSKEWLRKEFLLDPLKNADGMVHCPLIKNETVTRLTVLAWSLDDVVVLKMT